MVDISNSVALLAGYGRYNVYGAGSPVYSRSTELSVKAGSLSYVKTERIDSYKIDLTPRNQLSASAALLVQRVSGSDGLSEYQKTKLIDFISTIDAYGSFIHDDEGTTSAAVSMMITLSEQANARQQKQFETLDGKQTDKIVKETLGKNDPREEKSYVLSLRMMMEQVFFDMNGTSFLLAQQAENSMEVIKL